MHAIMIGLLLMIIYASSATSEKNGRDSTCGVVSERAAMEQMCYLLEKSIVSYKELLLICPDDSLSKHQMGISYILLDNSEVGLKYMQEAIDDLKAKKNIDLAVKLEESTRNWEANLPRITDKGVKFARERMQSTEECRKFILKK